MPGDLCVVCGNYHKDNPQLLFHRFPSNQAKRTLWIKIFELDPEAVKPHHRVCSWNFLNSDPRNGPQLHIGRRFSYIKKGSDRSAKAIERQQVWRIQELQSASSLASLAASCGSSNSLSSSASTSTSRIFQLPTESTTAMVEPITVSIGEQLIDNYQVTKLPDDGSTTVLATATSSSQQHLVETALLTRIEFLDA